jgi:cyclic pyranopterin phosphate synthase
MVDVGSKPESLREAVAVAEVRMSRATLNLVLGAPPRPPVAGKSRSGRSEPITVAKGDVLATARIAAIAALKRTAEWIPLCHPVRVVGTDVRIEPLAGKSGLRIHVTVRAFDRTGVEMEAMVGAAAAALTVYDMVKGVERGVEIVGVRLELKSGGRSGVWTRSTPARAGNNTRQRKPRKVK